MLFCEDCRIEKQWRKHGAFPLAGYALNEVCEVCRRRTDCHDVPAIRLIPDSIKTAEQKLLDRMMDQAYHKKCEELVIDFGGVKNNNLTNYLQAMFVRRDEEIDWIESYDLRLVAQRNIRASEESKRNRRL